MTNNANTLIDKEKLFSRLDLIGNEIDDLFSIDEVSSPSKEQFTATLSKALETSKNYSDLVNQFYKIVDPEYASKLILALAVVLSRTLENVEREIYLGDDFMKQYKPNDLILIIGNVKINENLIVSQNMFIVGDITVNGLIEVSTDWRYLIASGNILAHSLSTTGEGAGILCGENIHTDDLVLAGNSGLIIAGRELRATLAIASENNPAFIGSSKTIVNHFFDYEIITKENENNCPQLSLILMEEAFDDCDGEKVLWGINLWQLLVHGKPYLK